MNDIQDCPHCRSTMNCYNTADISGESPTRAHFLLSCDSCGHGPSQAFPTFKEAIKHWNNVTALNVSRYKSQYSQV